MSNCRICLCDYESGEKIRTLTCFHSFHCTCIDPWLEKNTKCPICRTDLLKEIVLLQRNDYDRLLPTNNILSSSNQSRINQNQNSSNDTEERKSSNDTEANDTLS